MAALRSNGSNQERIKGRQLLAYICAIPIVIPLKLFLLTKWREIQISKNLSSFKAITLKFRSNIELIVL